MPPDTGISSTLTLTCQQWELLGATVIFARDDPRLPSEDTKALGAVYEQLMGAFRQGIEDRLRNLLGVRKA